MIKHLSHNSIKNLLHLYNRIWTEQIFPDAWHNAIIIPFHKPGKYASDPKNYRPIALTSCLCKLLEKMVNSRLVYILETNNMISSWQSGFRRGRSTIDNILALETNIRNSFLRQNHLVCIFFDIEKKHMTGLGDIASYVIFLTWIYEEIFQFLLEISYLWDASEYV